MPSSSVSAQAAPPPPTLLLFNGLLILAFLSIPFLALRLLFLLPPLRPPPPPRKRPGGASPLLSAAPDSTATGDEDEDDDIDEAPTAYNASPTRLLVVLGSGGHTAEMLAMLRKLDAPTFLRSWTHRTYVVSEGDALSASRAREFEDELHAVARKHSSSSNDSTTAKDDQQQQLAQGAYDIHVVPRARRVHQSLLTTPVSALRCLAACFSIVRSPALGPTSAASPQQPTTTTTTYPDLILTNGPGTAVIVVLAALLLRFADVGDARGTSRVRTVYVESWARVRRLSLSGRLLLRVVDRFVVQWEELVGKTAGRGEYLGVLV